MDALSSGYRQAGVLERIFFWAVMILVAAATLIGLYFGLRCFFRWLMSGDNNEGGENRLRLGAGLRRLVQTFLSFCRAAAAGWKSVTVRRSGKAEKGDAAYLFRRLLAWGAKSGRPRLETETPLEYGESLKKLYPGLEHEIISITEKFNRHIYGRQIPEPGQNRELYRAWRRLLHPAFWPARIKIRLVGPVRK